MVSQLLFVNDSILFYDTEVQLLYIRIILIYFEAITSLKVKI